MAERRAVARRTSLRLLGRWHLVVDGVDVALGEREQRLVALLGLRGRRSWKEVARDLAPGGSDEAALSGLGWAVLETERRCPGLLRVDRATVALDPGVEVDVADLRRAARPSGSPVAATGGGDALLRLLGGPELLVGWYDDWVLVERGRIQRLRLSALDRLSARAFEAGDVDSAVVAAVAAGDVESPREASDLRRDPSRGDAADEEPGRSAVARVAALVGVIAAAALALALALVLALKGPGDPPPRAETAGSDPLRPARLVPAQVVQVEPRQLTVRASGAIGSVTLTIAATRRPAPVRLALWSTAGAGLAGARQVVVRDGSERFTWQGLAAGVYRWQATSPTARRARGQVAVAAVPTPVVPAPEASATPTVTPTTAPVPTPTAPAPSPSADPTPTATPTPGPTGPVDPHTHAPPPVG